MDNEQYIKEGCGSGCLDMGRGCDFCSCGESGEKEAHICEGCFKLHVTDWLADYPDNLPGDIFEVRFKNTRRGYYQNVNNLPLKEGDIVAVEASPGHDIGIVSLAGDMVARQMKRVGFVPQNGEFKKIYRKAKPYDIEKWQEAIALEHHTMIRSRQIAADMNLNMKIGDVEYQGDKVKAIFYYIADERVDFRELIKVFAEEFHIRVEMKQIGARQEAGRIGGLGSCGRELCCASWISSFISVTTGAARVQDISLNPQKLAGQCSKLKCCLIYEYDDYMDARKEFPRLNGPLQTLDADYHFIKNDILARTMSFGTNPGSMAGMVTLPIERVREIMKLNAKGVKPETIESVKTYTKVSDPGFVNVIGEDSITRFDDGRRGRKKKNGRGGDGRTNNGGRRDERGESGGRNEGRQENRPPKQADNAGKHEGGNRKGDRPQGQRTGEQRKGQQGEQGQQQGRPDGGQPQRQQANPRQSRQGGQQQGQQGQQGQQSRNQQQSGGQPRKDNRPKGRGNRGQDASGQGNQGGQGGKNEPGGRRQNDAQRNREGKPDGQQGENNKR